MNFKDWFFTEGWSIDLAEMPFDELRSKIGEPGAVQWLMGNAKFNYSGRKDLPSDFIKVIPFNRSLEVPSMELRKSIPSFEGVRIYYGFAFQDHHDYRDLYANYTDTRGRGGSPLQGVLKQIKQLEPYLKLHPTINRMVKPEADRYLQSIVIKPYQDALVFVETVVEGVMSRLRQSWRDQWFQELYYYVVYDIWAKLHREEQKLEQQFTNSGDVKKYIDVIKFAFAKTLKEPTTPEAEQMRTKFIRSSAENFYRRMADKAYDYVTYPESSKPFNELLANYLAKLFGAMAIKGFEKLPMGEITIDKRSLLHHYSHDREQAEKYYRFLQSRIANSGSKLKIHNIPQPLRRYVKMWQSSEGVNFRGKRILIVDDNIDQGGTFERVHDVALKQKPKAIDIYSPLYLGTVST